MDHKQETGARIRAPFADAVLRLKGNGDPETDIVSFHALPWSQGHSLEGGQSLQGSASIRSRYLQLFGNEFLGSEMSYAGFALDSFFRPSGPLDMAQTL